MVSVTELRNGAVFKEEGAPWMVLNYEHIKMGRGSGTIKVKVRNLKTGAITEKSFITGARVEDAELEKRKAQFLYHEDDHYHFMDPVSFEQFSIPSNIIGEQARFLKEGLELLLLVSDEQVLGIELPNSLVYSITETGPGEKGNTVSNVYKEAVLENGLIIKVPMFMSNGERVKVDTRTGLYVERVK